MTDRKYIKTETQLNKAVPGVANLAPQPHCRVLPRDKVNWPPAVEVVNDDDSCRPSRFQFHVGLMY